jgi:hypothetical protein
MKILIILLAIVTFQAHSRVSTTDIASAISCNEAIDSRYWIREFTGTFGQPSRNEGGALWWRASGLLYGSEITEVFVSNSRYWHFVGAVFKDRPEQLVRGIETSRFLPTRVFSTTGFWVGADSRIIMWHQGLSAKVFCVAGGNLPVKHDRK